MNEEATMGDWAVAVISDRYGGIYSHGKWLAIRGWPAHLGQEIWNGAYGEDPSAMRFWADPPDWIAVGDTPGEAMEALSKKSRVSLE